MIFEKIRERLNKAREEAKELQKTTTDAYGYMKMKQGLDCAIGIVDEVEAEYNNGWIPCDKEQPSRDGDYLILTSDGEIDVREYDYGNGWGWDGFERITYWQPLPQPPKGE